MQIEFTISGLKPTQRRRSKPTYEHRSVAPVIETIVLAYQIEQAIRDGRARDYAEVAKQIGITRARISQITCLLHLPAALLDKILLNPTLRQQLTERQLRPLVAASDSLMLHKEIEHLFC